MYILLQHFPFKSKAIIKAFDELVDIENYMESKIKKHLDKIHNNKDCKCIETICKSVITSSIYFSFPIDNICMKHFRFYDYSNIGYTIQKYTIC